MSPAAGRRPDALRGDQGSVIPFVAICLTLIVASAALSIDLGRLAVAGRESRTVADLAALDAARVLDGSPTAAQQATVEQAAARSAQRNGFEPGVDGTLAVTLGLYDRVTRTFLPTGPADVPDSVRVEVHRDSDNLFAPGSFGIDRTAIASASSSGRAALAVATTTSGVGIQETLVLDAVLGEALGAPVALTVTDWQALAGADVAFAELATVGAGLPADERQQLLDQTWTVADLVDALSAMPLPPAAASAVAQLVGLGVAPLPMRLADAIDVDLTRPGAADLTMGVGELLRTAAFLAAQGRSVPVALDPGFLGVASVTATVLVVEAATYAEGPTGTTARSARVRASVEAVLPDPALIPGAEPASVVVPLVLDSGRSEATLAAAPCTGAPEPASVEVAVTTAPSSVALGQPSGSLAGTGIDPATVATVEEPPPPNPVARVDADLDLDVAAAVGPLSFLSPFAWAPAQRLAVPGDPTSTWTITGPDLDVEDLGATIPLPTIADTVAADLDAAVPSLATALFDALGADLGAVDLSVPAAACRTAELVG